ncbi:MAG: polysaccharide biosynthesis C-terminal domain-containing protein [Cyclobacteriaceae bacterium]|nr:polysaccharide biosynthesis C-terminal domain-containing protein [Cyclobacteriaceae bacterium]
MSQLKSLASQTAIYGISSILGRVLNYALVPLHTSIFGREEMGNVAYLYTWVAFFMVVYTFGMETTLFRFSNKISKKNYFHYTGTFVLSISTVFSVLILFFSHPIANFLNVENVVYLVKWLAVILFIDAFTAIPFAKLRLENKAKQFAIAKMTNIGVNIGLQILFLIVFPAILKGDYFVELKPLVSTIFSNDLGIGYIFLANLCANLLLIVLLWKSLSQFRIAFNAKIMRPMLVYATPIVLTGLAGIASERIDILMLEQFLPISFYENMTTKEAIGLYSQTMKLSIFMLLAIQAFRYAGEPFFFSQAGNKNSPQLFAKILHYFVLLSLILFVGVSVNIDLIGWLFLRDSTFREALYLVPILLFGKLLWGIYINLSIWFKLTDKTIFGTYFSVLGAIITIITNLILIPLIGFDGSAIAMVVCYFVMTSTCYFYGQKYYPIPYNFKPLVVHIIIAITIIYAAQQIYFKDIFLQYGTGFLIFSLYAIAMWLIERRNLILNK